MQAGVDPEGPFHPEVFRIHREGAVADTAAEVVALALEKATTAQLPEAMPQIAQGLGANQRHRT
jgi:hypothetical protein